MKEISQKPTFIIADVQFLIMEGLKSLLKDNYELLGIVTGKEELVLALEKDNPQTLFIGTRGSFYRRSGISEKTQKQVR